MRPGSRLAGGVGLLLLGVLAFVLHGVLASNGDRAWENGRPPTAVSLTAGRTYHVASRLGLSGGAVPTSDTGTISCYYTADGADEVALTVIADSVDSRDLHGLGSFIAPVSGSVTLRCDGVAAVYVDDADGVPFDWSGLLVLVAIGLLLAGVIAVIGALMDVLGPAAAGVGEMQHAA